MQKSLAIIALAFIFASCGNKEKQMSDSERQARVDSLVGIRLEEINRQAMEDRDRRMSIEVKAKADSIVQAGTMPDNTVPNNLPQP